MTATVTLRRMTAAEYDAYRAHAVPMYAGDLVRARGMAPEEAHKSSVETFAATLDEAAAPDHSWLFRVLTSDGDPAGWLWLGPHPFRHDAAFVYDIEIDQPHRGRGLGRATMLAAEDVAREAGLTALTLNVFGWNHRAEALYRSLAYEVDSTTMTKPLTREKP